MRITAKIEISLDEKEAEDCVEIAGHLAAPFMKYPVYLIHGTFDDPRNPSLHIIAEDERKEKEHEH